MFKKVGNSLKDLANWKQIVANHERATEKKKDIPQFHANRLSRVN